MRALELLEARDDPYGADESPIGPLIVIGGLLCAALVVVAAVVAGVGHWLGAW